MSQHPVELLFGNRQPLSIRAVHHQNYELCVGIVGVPGRPERLLTSNVPHQEVGVFHYDFFHITSDRGRRMDNFVHEELVKDCSFSSIVKSNNDNFVLLITEEAPQFGKYETHYTCVSSVTAAAASLPSSPPHTALLSEATRLAALAG